MRKTMLFLLFFILTNYAKAQFFNDLIKAVGSVGKLGVQVVTAPTQVIINTGKVITGNGNPNTIYKPIQQIGTNTGSTLPQVVNLINQPQNFLMSKAQEFASSTSGKPGEFIVDIGTFTQWYFNELQQAGANNINGFLQGQNPFQITAAPLAASIRAARERHYQNSKPIPDDVKSSLKGYFNESTLNRARYTIGTIEITLPNFIGQGAKFMGGDPYAVTADDIIVFNTNPGLFKDNANWWSHEMTHVQQYERMGIETFAFNYIRDAGNSIETEAVSNANRITNSSYPSNSSALSVGSFNMVKDDLETDYFQNPEYYVIQCIFPGDRFGVMYLVTNYGRIIAVNPVDGSWIHIGYATPPRLQNVAWSYDLPNANWSYAVGLDGNIYNPYPIFYNGIVVNYSWVAIGYTIKLQ